MKKQTRTRVPDYVSRVINTATGEVQKVTPKPGAQKEDGFSECPRCSEKSLTDVSSCAVACLCCGYTLVMTQ